MGSSEAGTSSGSEYQVFLSFRGPNTHRGFTDFLYHSLTDAGICVFRDDEELPIGERIDGALPRAIDNSGIYIPIFSRTYASSQWCLREFAQIVENASKSNGHKEILPIFFDVEPDDVKLKTPLYRDAILNLEREKKLSTEQVDCWREALKKVDAIKGWEAKKYNGQGKLIKLVVEEVVKKLKTKQKSVTEHLIGINDRVVEVTDMLDFGGKQLIQIHGMGGIGKTTLAKVLFNQLSTHFGKYCCFLEDVQEKSSRTNGLVELQKKLLSEIGSAAGIESISATDYGKKRIEETLRNKKVFIVLDDIDKSEQVEKLVGTGALFSGSRVLITTRNKDVLEDSRLKDSMSPYEMKVMSSDHALQLFSRHAFNKDSPPDDHDDISKEIVSATGSLPLTIAIIGSLLNHETQDLWKETLDDLRKAPLEGVFEKLRISYNALTPEQQQIFLDIACFFIGEIMTNPIYMWTDCGFSPIHGIEVLKDKSLIKIGNDNEFLMHDQLRDLGREIVRQENQTIPGGCSRLWTRDEVLTTMKTEEMKKVQAMEVTHKSICIKSEEIGRFKELRFLRLDHGTFVGDLMDCFPKLKWIYLGDSPFSQCELINMCLKNVVVLEFSSVPSIDDQKLLQLIKGARKLKVLSFANCHGITRTPDLSECSTLERLTFLNCNGLTKIDGSIGKLKDLKDLKFDDCRSLEGLPEKIRDLRNLEHFSLQYSCAMKELPDFIFKWKSLRELQLSIARPVELPGAIGTENLKALQVEGNLKSRLTSEIGLLLQLQILELIGFDELRELPDLSNLTNLVRLKLDDGSKEIDGCDGTYTGDLEWIRGLSKLKKLSLCLLHVPAPTELASLTRLDKLRLCGLNLQPLKQLPSSLLELTLDNFNSITFLSSHLENLSNLRLRRSQMQEIRLDGLQLPNLMELLIFGCGPLERFMLSSMTKLEEVDMACCPKLDEIHIAGVLESLCNLDISECESFRRFVYVDRHWESSHESSLVLASRVFNKLRRLNIEICDKTLGIQVVGTSESLQELTIFGDHLQSLGGLSKLKNLKYLRINSTPELRHLRIVEGLDKLEFLEFLDLCDCPLLESLIDVSTTELPNDCYLTIGRCPKLPGLKQGFKGSVQNFKQYKEQESAQSMFWHPSLVSRAESSTQEQMHVPGKTEELLTPFEEKESVPAASTDPLMVSHAESSTQAQMRSPGNMEQLLAPFEQGDGDEDNDMAEIVDMFLKKDGDSEEVEQEVAKLEEKRQVASIKENVGTDDQVHQIMCLMDINDKDKQILVVIHGEDGIGKSTLAKLVYNQVSCDFDGCSFLADIEEATQVLGGLQLLQAKLISDVLKRELEDVAFVNKGIEFFRDLLYDMRVLIILDDVENAFHVQKLIRDCFDCFASGSRILVTTRNSVVLEECPQIRTYHVNCLDNDQALQLFRQHAPMHTSSSHSNFKLSNNALNAMAGLPLFIEVMAAVFNGKTREEWNNLVKQLLKRRDFQSILEGALDYQQKQRFLDIACFTTGIDSRISLYLWDVSPFLPFSEILTPLAKIGENNQIWMHRMLRQLGREIVRGENLTDPGMQSRIFNHEIALDTIKRKKGTKKVEALCLNFKWHTSDKLTPEDFQSMPNLRFLQLDHADIAGDFAEVFLKLRWLRWRGCPQHLQVTNFHLGNLTILDLSWSKVTKDWKAWDQIKMQNLRVLDLTGCADLLVTPKFSSCQNLAILILERCSQLVKIDHSISKLQHLVSLNLKFCTELSMLPVELGHLTALKELLMDGTSVQEIPISIGLLKQLETLSASNCFSLNMLPRTICHLTNISLLSLDGIGITAIPDSIRELVRLKHLSLRDCHQIITIPNSIGNIGRSLVELDVSGTGASEFPNSIKNLQNLKVLRMDSCFFREFPVDIGELTSLEEIHASWCRSLEGGIPSEIKKLHNLRILRLRHSSISSIPAEIYQLSNLRTLDLLHCGMIKKLPRLPSSITVLYVDDELKSSRLP